jgi:hypothetical protein
VPTPRLAFVVAHRNSRERTRNKARRICPMIACMCLRLRSASELRALGGSVAPKRAHRDRNVDAAPRARGDNDDEGQPVAPSTLRPNLMPDRRLRMFAVSSTPGLMP